MRIIIAGTRWFNNYRLFVEKCDEILKQYENIEIISGGAQGVDTMAEKYAKAKHYKFTLYEAQWSTSGRSAGYIRNVRMAENADVLIAIWNGNSFGTKHMIDIASNKGLKVHKVIYD